MLRQLVVVGEALITIGAGESMRTKMSREVDMASSLSLSWEH